MSKQGFPPHLPWLLTEYQNSSDTWEAGTRPRAKLGTLGPLAVTPAWSPAVLGMTVSLSML